MTGQRDGRFSLKEKKIPQLHMTCTAVLFLVLILLLLQFPEFVRCDAK